MRITNRLRDALMGVPRSVLWAAVAAEACAIAILAWPAAYPSTVAGPSAADSVPRDFPVTVSGCAVTEESYSVRWSSMEPMVADGTEASSLGNYYRCGGKVARGDVVIYESSATKGPVIKRVRALPGDSVALRGGTLTVNGEALANSAGVPYRFSSAESLMIGIYAPDGKLQDGAYLIFGDNVSNSTDSRKYGAVRAKDFLGKVILPGRGK